MFLLLSIVLIRACALARRAARATRTRQNRACIPGTISGRAPCARAAGARHARRPFGRVRLRARHVLYYRVCQSAHHVTRCIRLFLCRLTSAHPSPSPAAGPTAASRAPATAVKGPAAAYRNAAATLVRPSAVAAKDHACQSDYGKTIPPPCPKNEVYRCQNTCPPDGCVTLYAAFDCIANQTCVNGCYCKDDYLRIGRNGPCVPRDQCPPRKTETDDSEVPTVPVTSVPRRCPPNEELKLRGSCPPDTCDMLYISVFCIANQTQELLCTCKSGYLRRNTTCVPEDRCLPPECADDPNAIRGCGNRCGKTCADYNNTTKVCNNNVCHINGCDCKDGLVYDQNTNRCVKPEQCTKQCKGSHEIYIDCPAGQCKAKTCDDLVNPPGCPRIKPPCPGGCVCEDGYFRDKSGKCIPKEQCPSLQCKKKNERWSNCVIGECVPRACEDVGYPVACPDIIGPCAGGCTCIEGFVKNSKGDCIDMKDCPSCGGDPNAVSGCGNPCGKTCASLYANNSDLICPQYCEYNGCDCKSGYRLLTDSTDSTESKKCVPESECPKRKLL
ncbi:zonadhesin-like [Cydia strobilella]|uniref:zonadhesin-like n=1 Tax=Cydia strobilella TaxID=1100964 RepID=UPI003005DCEA